MAVKQDICLPIYDSSSARFIVWTSYIWFDFIVFNATFNNISAISKNVEYLTQMKDIA